MKKLYISPEITIVATCVLKNVLIGTSETGVTPQDPDMGLAGEDYGWEDEN